MKIIDTTKTKLMSFSVITIALFVATSLATTIFIKAGIPSQLQVFLYLGIFSYYLALSIALVSIKTKAQPEQLKLAF